jgi:glycosyltransferase involved in cell wall biosynthesis
MSSVKRYIDSLIAAESNTLARYFDYAVQLGRLPNDSGMLLGALDCKHKLEAREPEQIAASVEVAQVAPGAAGLVLLNGTINHSLDIEGLLSQLKPHLERQSRVLLVAYNPYFDWLYRLANVLGLRTGPLPCTFVTRTALENIAALSGYQVVRTRFVAQCPFRLMGLGDLINFLLPAIPFVRKLGLAAVVTLRPVMREETPTSVSVIIPVRNERGTLEAALQRMPQLGTERLEVIFVEGHSSDGSWEELQRLLPLYQQRFKLSAYQQSGNGKSDAVRLGFAKATHDLLMVLDADLTMPPELLSRYYQAYQSGLADFINGNRLLYPIQGQEMKFLNRLANVIFAKLLSYVLEVPLADSLCGTKVLARRDYQRLTRWREDFGDFDPFGDFELLFPAAVLGLGVIDIPIRYRERAYGSTNIRRFYHGWQLLRMALLGLWRLRMGRVRVGETTHAQELSKKLR